MDLISFLKVFQQYLNKDEHKKKTNFNIEKEEVDLARLQEWLYDRLLEMKKYFFFFYFEELLSIKMYWIFSRNSGNGQTK